MAALDGFIYHNIVKYDYFITCRRGDIEMLKRTVVILAAAAFFGGAVPTQTAQASSNVTNLMNPSWWADKIFDNHHDDDWWYYRHSRYNPYWGGPYRWRPQLIVIEQEPETNQQPAESEPPQ